MFPAFILILITLLQSWLVPTPPVEVTPVCGYERIVPVPTVERTVGYPASTAPVRSCGDRASGRVRLAELTSATPADQAT